jgi:hypothetical protein
MLSFLLLFLPAVLVLATRPLSRRSHCRNDSTFNESVSSSLAAPASVPSESHHDANCFPSLSFKTPPHIPSSIDGWWCSATTEYAFLGFSYEVTPCASVFFNESIVTRTLTLSAGQSLQQLKNDFADMRSTFHSRYVRLYGACDREGFYDDIIEAAWHASLGVHALIWVSLHATCMPISSYLFESQFGFDGTDQWVDRRDRLFRTLHSNPKAKFVTRVVQFGSEPLFDHVLSPDELAAQVLSAKKRLSSLDIPVTVSELAYGYQANGGAQNVLDAIDSINIHMLPFFSSKASTGKVSPPNLLSDCHSASHRSKRLAPGSQ